MVSGRIASSASTSVSSLLRLDRDADDLLRQPPLVGRPGGELVRARRPAVHVGAGHLELVGDLARLVDHLLVGERVGEPVVGHRVDRLHVAHPEPEARPRQQVGSAAHRLHAAGHRQLEVAGANRLVGEADRAHARGADLVDRLRGDLARDPGLDLRLARGNLSLSGLQHLAVDHLLDLIGRDLGALQRGGDGRPAELGRALRGQRPRHLAERGASGAEDDCLRHLGPFFGSGGRLGAAG